MAAAIIAAIIVGGTMLYTADQQADAQEEADKKLEKQRLEEEERLKQIALDTKPEGERATVEFGKDPADNNGGGSYQDFLFKPNSKLGASEGSGLGQTANKQPVTSLGF